MKRAVRIITQPRRKILTVLTLNLRSPNDLGFFIYVLTFVHGLFSTGRVDMRGWWRVTKLVFVTQGWAARKKRKWKKIARVSTRPIEGRETKERVNRALGWRKDEEGYNKKIYSAFILWSYSVLFIRPMSSGFFLVAFASFLALSVSFPPDPSVFQFYALEALKGGYATRRW